MFDATRRLQHFASQLYFSTGEMTADEEQREWVSGCLPRFFFFFFLVSLVLRGNVKCLSSVLIHCLPEGGGREQNRRNIKIHAHTHLTVPHACLPSANTHCEGRLNTSSAINQSRQIFYGMFSLFLVYSSEGLCACCVSDWTKKKKERADKIRNH